MMTDNWLLMIAMSLVEGICHWFIMQAITRRRPKLFFLPIFLAYHVVLTIANNLDWVSTFSVVLTVINFIAFFLMTRYFFGLRGKQLFIGYLKIELCLVVISLLSMVLLRATPYWTDNIRLTDTQLIASMAAYVLAACVLFGLLWLCTRLAKVFKRHPALPYALRIALVVVFIVLAVFARTLLPQAYELIAKDAESTERITVLLVGMSAIACVLGVLFIYQDIRTLQQMRRNETLNQKQKMIDELLTSMRGFRHNIGNLLHGMEGAMLTDDAAETKEYYNQLVEKCTLVNSENIVAVQNLSIPPLAALLLHKIDEAYNQGIPVYLYIEPHTTVRGMSKSDLCEITGVLLDNALEAAKDSPSPYVSLELRALTDETELVVRNTFLDSLGTEALSGVSTKPGHEGIGIRSVREILGRRSESFLNLRVAGRYVEAQVLIG